MRTRFPLPRRLFHPLLSPLLQRLPMRTMRWVFTAMPTWSLRGTQARESGLSLFLTPRLRIFTLFSSVRLRRRLRTPFREPGSTCSLCGVTSAREDGVGEGRGEREDHTLSCVCRRSGLRWQVNQRSCAVRRRVERVPTDHEAPSEQQGDGALGRGLSCLGRMPTRKPRRERAGNNAENLRPHQPIFQTAVCCTRSSPWLRVFLVTHTRGPDTARRNPRPCEEDGCLTHPWTRPTASHAQAWKRSTTRKLAIDTRRSDEEPLLRSGGAPLHAQLGGE